MLVATIVMGAVALVLLYLGYRRGDGAHIEGIKVTLGMMLEILPLLFFAFLVAGMAQVLIPQELISRLVGSESGWRGIIIGAVAGSLAPGGPYVSLPIAAGLLKAGANVGTAVAFLAGWSLWSIPRVPMEVGILGWKFTVVRLLSTFVFPVLAGFVAQLLFGGIKF